MSLMLNRLFAYFTLVCYLVVGTMVVRFCLPETVSVSFSTAYLNLISDAPIKAAPAELLAAPELHFAEIKIPVEKKIARRIVKPVVQVIVAKMEEKLPEAKVLAVHELPFQETIKLSKVEMTSELPTNMVALYKDFAFEETIVAEKEVQIDEVSTSMAAAEMPEPEFFEYPVEAKKEEAAQVTETKIDNQEIVTESSEIETQDVNELMEPKAEEPAMAEALVESETVEPEFFDYPAKVTTQVERKQDAPLATIAPKVDQVAVSNFVGFDYSQANKDIGSQMIPTVAKVNSQKVMPKIKPSTDDKKNQLVPEVNAFMGSIDEEQTPPPVVISYPVSLSIRALGSDLKKLEDLQGFEVRYQDDLSEMVEDYGSGEVKLEAEMSQTKMTRSITVLKRGYIPTSSEVILEEGNGSVSIPLIEEHTLNDLMIPFERRGPVGTLLVELDDETDVAKIDVPFGEVVKLNGDFKRTENEDFRYQLFVGVQAGNAMVSYHRGNTEVVSKIVHVHENEVTYDANFYEDVVNEKVRLYEEELLSKESSPLIISGDQVKVFAAHTTAKKINNHTYKMNFGSSHLGGRRYLELNHQSEPVFVGIRDNNNVNVPSENFMRFILSKVEGANLGNRCLVQVNLTKKAQKFDVASESVEQSLMTTTQVLDTDGKFYDSLSDKTRKIIIIGEAQGAAEISPDAKINIKIQYQDGSIQFLNSYCSPNTYLVEQL